MLNISKEQIEYAVKNSSSMAEAATSLNINYKTFRVYAKKFFIFLPNQGGSGTQKSKISLEDILSNKVYVKSSELKERLLKENLLEYKCAWCNIHEWREERISLELDHINGNGKDNNLSNLRLLCPNCHSQTLNFRGRKTTGKKNKYTEEQFIEAYKTCSNVTQICKALNIATKGGNFETIRKKIVDFKVKGIF